MMEQGTNEKQKQRELEQIMEWEQMIQVLVQINGAKTGGNKIR